MAKDQESRRITRAIIVAHVALVALVTGVVLAFVYTGSPDASDTPGFAYPAPHNAHVGKRPLPTFAGDDNGNSHVDPGESGWNCYLNGNRICGPDAPKDGFMFKQPRVEQPKVEFGKSGLGPVNK